VAGIKKSIIPNNLSDCKKLNCKFCLYDIGVNTDLCKVRLKFACKE